MGKSVKVPKGCAVAWGGLKSRRGSIPLQCVEHTKRGMERRGGWVGYMAVPVAIVPLDGRFRIVPVKRAKSAPPSPGQGKEAGQ